MNCFSDAAYSKFGNLGTSFLTSGTCLILGKVGTRRELFFSSTIQFSKCITEQLQAQHSLDMSLQRICMRAHLQIWGSDVSSIDVECRAHHTSLSLLKLGPQGSARYTSKSEAQLQQTQKL